MAMSGRLACLLLLLCIGLHAHAQIYKCVDHGAITFLDRPCASGAQSQVKTSTGAPENDIKFDIVTNHYMVAGANLGQVYRTLVTQNASRAAGWARWDVTYTFDTLPKHDLCSVERAHIVVKGQILMPKWETAADASPADQQAWQTMYGTLLRHEEGHIQNGRDFALLFRERLVGIANVPCDSIKGHAEAIYRTLYKNLQDRDAEYDRRTQHGVREWH